MIYLTIYVDKKLLKTLTMYHHILMAKIEDYEKKNI